MRRAAAAVAAAVALVAGISWWAEGPDGASGERPSLTVFGPWLGAEADAFVASMEAFEDASGVDVRYTGSRDFADDLRERVAGRIAVPDVALVPQPGLVLELLEDDVLQPLDEAALTAMDEHYPTGRDAGAIGGRPVVVPYRASVKSLVWYRPDVWAAMGWEAPDTLDGLTELADEIARRGEVAPWCFTTFSGADSGWPVTDWVEDVLLRRAGPDVYDRFRAERLPYTDQAVVDAFEEVGDLLLAEGRTAGGVRRVLETGVASASAPLFADPPGCAMYKQATFATTWFPEGTEVGPEGDVDFFVLPGVDPDVPPPLVATADVAVQLVDRPAVDRFMAYLATPESGAAWAGRGGYISDRTGDGTGFALDLDRRASRLLAETEVVAPDASDLLAPDVRSQLLEGVTGWVARQERLPELLATMEALRTGG